MVQTVAFWGRFSQGKYRHGVLPTNTTPKSASPQLLYAHTAIERTTMNIDEDTCEWLGCSTPLEMYKHQCALLEDEISDLQRQLSKSRANIAGLVHMNDLLITWKTAAEEQIRSISSQLSNANVHNSEQGKEIMSLKMIASQNEHFRTENQRLLLELTVLRGPQP